MTERIEGEHHYAVPNGRNRWLIWRTDESACVEQVEGGRLHLNIRLAANDKQAAHFLARGEEKKAREIDVAAEKLPGLCHIDRSVAERGRSRFWIAPNGAVAPIGQGHTFTEALHAASSEGGAE